jgi:hypothetical protein
MRRRSSLGEGRGGGRGGAGGAPDEGVCVCASRSAGAVAGQAPSRPQARNSPLPLEAIATPGGARSNPRSSSQSNSLSLSTLAMTVRLPSIRPVQLTRTALSVALTLVQPAPPTSWMSLQARSSPAQATSKVAWRERPAVQMGAKTVAGEERAKFFWRPTRIFWTTSLRQPEAGGWGGGAGGRGGGARAGQARAQGGGAAKGDRGAAPGPGSDSQERSRRQAS